jgi:hypothetical protein
LFIIIFSVSPIHSHLVVSARHNSMPHYGSRLESDPSHIENSHRRRRRRHTEERGGDHEGQGILHPSPFLLLAPTTSSLRSVWHIALLVLPALAQVAKQEGWWGRCWTAKVSTEEELMTVITMATGDDRKDFLFFIDVVTKEIKQWGRGSLGHSGQTTGTRPLILQTGTPGWSSPARRASLLKGRRLGTSRFCFARGSAMCEYS